MFERYTKQAQSVISLAQYEAGQFGSLHIETEHILLALLREDRALTHHFLRTPTRIESIRGQIEKRTGIREQDSATAELSFGIESIRVLAYAAEEAERLGHGQIGTEHLLLGLLSEEKCLAAAILHERGLRLNQVRDEIARRQRPGTAG